MLMKKVLAVAIVSFLMPCVALAAGSKEQDRVRDAGEVMKEILNIPDNIPQELLDKAECVFVLPSVKKGAFGIGGSYGPGRKVCRNGQHSTGQWGAPDRVPRGWA